MAWQTDIPRKLAWVIEYRRASKKTLTKERDKLGGYYYKLVMSVQRPRINTGLVRTAKKVRLRDL